MSFIKRRLQPKRKLSPFQSNRLKKIIFVLLVSALVWIFFAPRSGIMALMVKRSELNKIQRETAQLEQEIAGLREEIDRLQNDPAYLEAIARKRYGLLKKNEQVFDFSKEDPGNDK